MRADTAHGERQGRKKRMRTLEYDRERMAGGREEVARADTEKKIRAHKHAHTNPPGKTPGKEKVGGVEGIARCNELKRTINRR